MSLSAFHFSIFTQYEKLKDLNIFNIQNQAYCTGHFKKDTLKYMQIYYLICDRPRSIYSQ